MNTAWQLLPRKCRELLHAVANVLIGFVPAMLTGIIVYDLFKHHWTAYDLHYSYYPAAHRLLSGGSPYAVPAVDIHRGLAFVYPALAAIVFAPFALFGRTNADHLYMLACFLMIPITLWAAGVRDWRVYGPPFMWLPIIVGWQGGNVSVPLTCLVALAWRYRDRPLVAGFVAGVAISLKPFVWPLALWLLVTRRWRAAAYCLLSGLVLNLLAWAIVGFDQIHVYLRLSGQVTDALWRGGYSVLAVAHHLGIGRGAGEALLLTGSLLLVAGLVYVGFIQSREREAMILTVALMLFASPLVWSHYFVLLLVPLALARPRWDPIWYLPCTMWICPPSFTANGREVALAWLVSGYCFVTALRGRPAPAVAVETRRQVERPVVLSAARLD